MALAWGYVMARHQLALADHWFLAKILVTTDLCDVEFNDYAKTIQNTLIFVNIALLINAD